MGPGMGIGVRRHPTLPGMAWAFVCPCNIIYDDKELEDTMPTVLRKHEHQQGQHEHQHEQHGHQHAQHHDHQHGPGLSLEQMAAQQRLQQHELQQQELRRQQSPHQTHDDQRHHVTCAHGPEVNENHPESTVQKVILYSY